MRHWTRSALLRYNIFDFFSSLLGRFACSSARLHTGCGKAVNSRCISQLGSNSSPLAPPVQHTTKAVALVSSAETKGSQLQRDADRVFAAQRMEVTPHAHGQGIHHSPGGSARNSWKSLASAG